MLAPAVAPLAHAAFEWAALIVGARLYVRASSTSLSALGQTRNFSVLFGCIAGAALGNKAVHWIQHAERWPLLVEQPLLFLQGQSIVGGLLGGLIGVEIGKWVGGVSGSTGDRFVLPVLVGLIVGRIGCFLAGLSDDTYGVATRLPWGVDFGDGVSRHPTQLYDIAYAIVALVLRARYRSRLVRKGGLQFKLLLASYLAWRLCIDAIKPVPFAYPFGLSGIQLVCLLSLAVYLPIVINQIRRP